MLDSWEITDADPVWDFRVDVFEDLHAGRPEGHGDVYDAAEMKRAGNADPRMSDAETAESVQWAHEAVKAWEENLWQFAMIDVTPILKGKEVIFLRARTSLHGCDYGWLPGPDGGTRTDGREYVRNAWVNDMIESCKFDISANLDDVKEILGMEKS